MAPIHVQLFPALQPTLESEQRSYHRLRSTRKLEATTPLFITIDAKVDDKMAKTPTLLSPRTRAIRRQGQVFHSESSTGSVDFGVSLRVEPVTRANNNNPRSGKTVKIKAGHRLTLIKGQVPQSLTLQLRSRPLLPTSSVEYGIPLTLHPKPLSPISPSFNMDTTTTHSHPHHVLTTDQKLRKLAKLADTFGEPVPLKLVFRSSSPPPSPLMRTASLTISRPHRKSHRPSLSQAFTNPSLVPPTEVPEPQSTRISEDPLKPQRRRVVRPRSMTLATGPIMGTPSPRGATSLDISVKAFDPPFTGITTAVDANTTVPEWGRRKEKEWSGEWNIKDMDYVVKALRGLKAR